MTYIRRADNARARIRLTGDGKHVTYIAETKHGEGKFNSRAAAERWLRSLGYSPETEV